MTVLVTGANGDQGGHTARRLLERGHPVCALVTDPGKPSARTLAEAGAQVMAGDLADPDDVRRAVHGADAVFAVPVGGPDEAEKARIGRLLIEAARENGVRHFVQSSVAALPAHLGFGDPGTGYSFEPYARARLEIEETVRAAGFRHWTILQPVAFMENFAGTKARHMYPGMTSGRLDSTRPSDARVQHIAARDIAAFAVAAVDDSERFTRHSIQLASQALSMGEIAAVLSEETGRPYTHRSLTLAEATDAGIAAGVVHSQLWDSRIGYHAPLADDLEKQWGIRPLTFRDWARANRHLLSSGQGQCS
ncbi:NmrA family NAD(P)-binding protein [Streptomyces sp. NPDC004647]|uniref:NmrA family NAD(P)-binding protein n=1 Tax=Streptomyces sp. NPDC004647 TaxID=3154671 RepID=UPI0033BFAC2B